MDKNKKIKLEEITKDIIRERMKSTQKQIKQNILELKELIKKRGYNV